MYSPFFRICSLLLVFALVFTSQQCQNSIMAGTISVNMDGVMTDNYVAVSGGTQYNQVTVSSGNNISLTHNTRAYFANKCVNNFASDMFTWFHLLGKTIQFTVDLSNVGCGCNAALYLVSMPGCSSGESGDYYCDANAVGGQWCPEIDIMEANLKAFQVTPHICYGQQSWCQWNSCDQGGEGFNFRDGGYSQINAYLPFNVTTYFITDQNGNLKQISTVLLQDSVRIEHSNVDINYLQQLTGPMGQGNE
jgi:hypothetical protein